jgi:ABC-type nitrate/sulfonate/bicarbonate transport system substrate-binding protein
MSIFSRRDVLAGVALLCAAILPSGAIAADPTPLKIGVLPYVDYQLLYVSHEKGFDKELGYDLQFTQFALEPQATRGLVRGDIDIAQGAIGSLLSQLPERPDLRVALSGALYRGFAFIIRSDSKLKTYPELFAELGDHQKALDAVIDEMIQSQLLTTESSFQGTIAGLVAEGGHNYSELNVLNFAEASQAGAAFVRGTGDIFLGGTAQTTRLMEELSGYKVLIENEQMGAPGLWYSNAYVTEAYLKDHRQQLLDLTAIWQRTVRYMNAYPDEAFAIMADKLGPQTGSVWTVEDLKNEVPRLTYFPTTEEAKTLVFDLNSPASWKAVTDFQFEQAKLLGTDLSAVNADDFIVQDEIFAEFLANPTLQAYVDAPF